MKKLFRFMILSMFIVLLPSCATIFGGGKYYAKVMVPDHPMAKIEYNGMYKGTGQASFLVHRKEADNFVITVAENGCKEEVRAFNQKVFRGWAFTGSLLFWTGVIPGTIIPLPWGIALDGANGAWWKPDVKEAGVSKENHKHFSYIIDYTGCNDTQELPVTSSTN